MNRSISPVSVFLAGFNWYELSFRQQLLVALMCFSLGFVALMLAGQAGLRIGWVRSLAVTWSALWLVPFVGHVVRRLNALRWPAALALLLILPGINLVFLLAVLVLPAANRARAATHTNLRDVGLGFTALGALFIWSMIFWTVGIVRSADMKPALLPGDVVAIWLGGATITNGDVIALQQNPDAPLAYARVIARAGESVSLEAGVPLVNGTKLTQTPDGDYRETMRIEGPDQVMPRCRNGLVGQGGTCEKTRLIEALHQGTEYPVLDTGPSKRDSFAETTVFSEHVFVLGDNRDEADDSRIVRQAGGMGQVGAPEIVGPVSMVFLSAYGRSLLEFWTVRPNRFMKRVR